MCATFMTNVLATSLTAGRIAWISRTAARLLPTHTKRRYDTSCAIMLETGIIYPLTLVVLVICTVVYGALATTEVSTIAYNLVVAILYQVVGIAPTLIVVRVGLGVSVDGLDDMRPLQNLNGNSTDVVLDIRPKRGILD
ncbi:hypothetical protein C8J56DRAFT_541287 [Mycena floridula]|nr:hypothetical protein C8J56DRAFT_541287 [Mycena floridula]